MTNDQKAKQRWRQSEHGKAYMDAYHKEYSSNIEKEKLKLKELEER